MKEIIKLKTYLSGSRMSYSSGESRSWYAVGGRDVLETYGTKISSIT